MHRRSSLTTSAAQSHHTLWPLDDEFLRPQVARPNNNKNSALMPQHSDLNHPIAPWGFIIAWFAIALSLSLLLSIVLTGGPDLG